MSANNYLLIRDTDKPCGDYELSEHDADTGEQIGGGIVRNGDLKALIQIATEEMKNNIVEYGLYFDICYFHIYRGYAGHNRVRPRPHRGDYLRNQFHNHNGNYQEKSREAKTETNKE